MPVFAKIAQHLRRKGEAPNPPQPGDYFGWRLTDPNRSVAIHFKANGNWVLTGYDDEANRDYRIHMRSGEFTLEFKPHSVNLALVAIDPDPGGGGLIE